MGKLGDAAKKVGEFKLKAAFMQRIFVYGTTGGGSALTHVINMWNAKRAKENEAGESEGEEGSSQAPRKKKRLFHFYDPGPRTNFALDNQMMDLYYGEEGTFVHERRDPTIGEYVHFAMGFKGPFSMKQSGREAYLETFGRQMHGGSSSEWRRGKVCEGWEKPLKVEAPRTSYDGYYYPDPSSSGHGLTGTKEMSRVIREGIRELGGTLVFEGSNVTYESVFVPGAYVSDTSLEAENLFQYFTPGKSTVPFGKGKIVFHWFGKEEIPTQFKFHANWLFAKEGNKPVFHTPPNRRKDYSTPLKPIYNNFARM